MDAVVELRSNRVTILRFSSHLSTYQHISLKMHMNWSDIFFRQKQEKLDYMVARWPSKLRVKFLDMLKCEISAMQLTILMIPFEAFNV